MKNKIHSSQSTIPESAYKPVKGILFPNTVEKLKAAGKQIIPKKVIKKKQGTFDV
jgi:hypothetical protein